MESKPAFDENGIQIYQGDCREVLRSLPADSVHCVVTSPPYWGLRDYGTAQWKGGDTSCDHKRSNFRPDHTGSNLHGRGTQNHSANSSTPYLASCGKCGAVRVDNQIGLEQTPDQYLTAMVEVFREVRRVLRSDGTLWLNMGDCYAAGNKGNSGADQRRQQLQAGNQQRFSRYAPTRHWNAVTGA